MAKIYPFRGRGFHTPVEWKIGYYVINKQIIIQILILNTAVYIYGHMILKEISILNLFEHLQENTISGSAFSARLGTRPWLSYPTYCDYLAWGRGSWSWCFSCLCSVCACLGVSVSSSSLGLGRAVVSDCGTPWTFLLPFLVRFELSLLYSKFKV